MNGAARQWWPGLCAVVAAPRSQSSRRPRWARRRVLVGAEGVHVDGGAEAGSAFVRGHDGAGNVVQPHREVLRNPAILSGRASDVPAVHGDLQSTHQHGRVAAQAEVADGDRGRGHADVPGSARAAADLDHPVDGRALAGVQGKITKRHAAVLGGLSQRDQGVLHVRQELAEVPVRARCGHVERAAARQLQAVVGPGDGTVEHRHRTRWRGDGHVTPWSTTPAATSADRRSRTARSRRTRSRAARGR